MLIALGIVLFILLIVVHEYGHFLAAKRNGVEVEEFGIGFPPRIYGRTMGKGIFRGFYSVNLLPLGGFVKLKGETDADTRKGSFGAASFGAKTQIILAGVVMNFIAAAAILTVLSWTGMPRLVEDQFTIASDTTIGNQSVLVGFVAEDSPGAAAGLELGDELISLGGTAIISSDQLFELTDERAGETQEILYVRDNQQQRATITLNGPEAETQFGVAPTDLIVERSTWSAPLRGLGLTAQFSWLTLSGVYTTIVDLVNGNGSQAAESVTGPVGIFVLLRDISEAGLSFVMFFIALISITLGVMNALPIPALDGGRLFVSGLFKLLKRPLSPQLEQRIHSTGMVALLMLIALITVVDVRRFF
jgi:regulator of sigma E protease